MTGGGKYDEETKRFREDVSAAGVITMIMHGKKGDGFEVQIPPEVMGLVPAVLREMANKIEADLIQLTTGNKG